MLLFFRGMSLTILYVMIVLDGDRCGMIIQRSQTTFMSMVIKLCFVQLVNRICKNIFFGLIPFI